MSTITDLQGEVTERPEKQMPDSSGNSAARSKLRQLWQMGDLFHATERYSHKRAAAHIDRLAGILHHGLVSPGACEDGTVCSDLNIVATGMSEPYDRLVFLHRFGERSFIYTMCMPGRFFIFVDPAIPVLTPEEMGPKWVLLCQDEVYVRERVPVERLIALVAHSEDADAVLAEFLPDLERLGLPLYSTDGTVVWPQE
ncbi:MAG: hypothetical protein ABI977_29570 [Acidobacteriota bacterium]